MNQMLGARPWARQICIYYVVMETAGSILCVSFSPRVRVGTGGRVGPRLTLHMHLFKNQHGIYYMNTGHCRAGTSKLHTEDD